MRTLKWGTILYVLSCIARACQAVTAPVASWSEPKQFQPVRFLLYISSGRCRSCRHRVRLNWNGWSLWLVAHREVVELANSGKTKFPLLVEGRPVVHYSFFFFQKNDWIWIPFVQIVSTCVLMVLWRKLSSNCSKHRACRPCMNAGWSSRRTKRWRQGRAALYTLSLR